MLTITIPATKKRLWNEKTKRFLNLNVPETTIRLEHSLVSIAKWESKYHKPFLNDKEEKTAEETLDYVRFMTITQNVNPEVYEALSNANMAAIEAYISDPMSARIPASNKKKKKKKHSLYHEPVTAELIYFWMISWNIPIEFQKWPVNRLINLIELFNEKNEEPEKLSNKEILARQYELNEKRKREWGTSG